MTELIRGLEHYKEHYSKPKKLDFQMKIVRDYISKLTGDNKILKRGINTLANSLNEEKQKNTLTDHLD